MAYIKDAFMETVEDNNSFFKIFVLAIPVYYCTNIYMNGSKEEINSSWFIFMLTFLLLFGFVIQCTANVRNYKNNVMPSLNIFKLMWSGLKGTAALGPSLFINCLLAKWLCEFTANHIPESNVLTIFKFIIWCLFISVFLTGYLCFAKTFKIADAYNFKAISKSCADIMIAVLFMIPQVLLAAGIVLLPVGYIMWLFFGVSHGVSLFCYSLIFVFTLAITGHYLAQIDFETLQRDEDEAMFK